MIYPATIGQAEFLPLLADCAGIALSGTPYKQTELDASPAIQVVARIGVGYDAVEVPALTVRKVPLMVAVPQLHQRGRAGVPPDDLAGQEA